MGDQSKLTDDARAAIADAVRILRDDGVHIHRTYDRYLKSKVDKESATGDKLADVSDPDKTKTDPPPPPPNNDPPNGDVETKKRGLWWGDKSDD
jgi:hypothetical protein